MRVICLLSLVLLLNSALFSQQAGGTLSYCEEKLPRTNDPITSFDDQANDRLSTLLYSGLFEINISRKAEKRLAESYAITDDRKKITINLRHGIKWSDGGEVSAKDVYATYKAIQTSKNTYLKRLVEVFGEPSVDGNYQISFPIRAMIPEDVILKRLIFKILPFYKISSVGKKGEMPVGSGNYRLISQDFTRMELEKNNNNMNSSRIERIKIYKMADFGSQKESLINKQIDLLLEVPPTEVKYLETSGFDIIPYNSYEFSFIAINFKHKLLQNKNVRQAMTLGYNRNNVLDKVYQRQGEVISGPFTRGNAYYNESVRPMEYSPKTAIKLLNDEGFTKILDGVRVNSGGEKLQFTILVPRNPKWDDYQSKAIKQFTTDMADIGIKIVIQDIEFESYLDRIKMKHDYDLAYCTFVFDDAGDVSPLFLSTNSASGQENFISYNNQEIDQFLKQQRETQDEAKKINLGRRVHKYLRDDCPYIFLWSLDNNAAANSRVRNVHSRVTPFTFFGQINEWYIKE